MTNKKVFFAVMAVLAFSASPALAETECSTCKPWWGLTSSARPANLNGDQGKDEVQRLTVNATKGDYLLVESSESRIVVVPFDATAGELQQKLESTYPTRKVLVGEEPSSEPNVRVYTVTFPAQAVEPIFALAENEELANSFGGEPLEGGKAEVNVAEIAKGASTQNQVIVLAENLGDSEAEGAIVPVTIADKIPPGMVATAIEGFANQALKVPLSCSFASLSCVFTKPLAPYDALEIVVSVKPDGASSGEDDEATVTGGEAPSVSIKQPIPVSDEPVPFGVESYGMALEDEGGAPDTQAGSHPYQLTSTLALNQTTSETRPPAPAKDLYFDLPAGLVGNPTPFPQCTDLKFDGEIVGGGNQCPRDTVVGVASTTLALEGKGSISTFPVPLFNLTPEVGEPARFGFEAEGNPVILDTSVRTGSDYGVTVSVHNITESVNFISSRVTFWGVPGDPSHDASRDWECIAGGRDRTEHSPPCAPLGQANPPPFLTLPTSCTGPLRTTVQADSWAQPNNVLAPLSPNEPLQSLDGCNQLRFDPEIEVAPDVQEASTPSGLKVDVHVPQEGQLNPTGLSQSNVKDITVRLPEGVSVDPAAADGLEACSEGLIGYLPGESSPPEELHFTPRKPGSFGTEGSEATLQPGINFCPDASKVGTVKIKLPILPNALEGAVYLASQNANPFGSLMAAYIVAEDPVSGVLLKLPGEVSLNQQTGQFSSTFLNSPQGPLEDAEFHFFGGERAPFSTPAHCGTYTTDATFTPWSGSAPVTSRSSFEITSGPNHGPCPGASLPFSPSLTGGATNLQAGAFSPFTLTMSRKDGEQNMQSVEAHLPPGLSGILSNIELCPELQANIGKCGPHSLIGETTVSVGVGGNPYTVSGGKFYLTGPYNGSGGCIVGEPGCAPFGIAFEVPAKAGPFDLERNSKNPEGEDPCDCVLVRGKIEINPQTSALTITSNPPGTPDAIPTSIEGIPLEIQHVNAITTRGNFQFNPTNCSKMEVTGTIHSSVGGLDTIGVPFQVTNCAALKFEPKLSVSTSGKTSRAKGASLTAKVTYPKVPQGTDADIAKVKVDLPKQLPSRLTTLQKACTAKQFDADPAGCPGESKIGYAVVHTPILPVPLVGPAIFVSHGGEAFPSLTMVLQGDGVTIELVSTTFISKAGITSSTFKMVPDQPFSSFELTLPEGKYSALAANGNLCSRTSTKTVKKKITVRVKGHKQTETRKVKETVSATLQMPTAFVAQNGAEIHKTTPISVTGCPKKAKVKVKKVKRA